MDKMSLLPKAYEDRVSTRRAKRLWTGAVVVSALLAIAAIGVSSLETRADGDFRYDEKIAAAKQRALQSKQQAEALGVRLAQNRQALSAIEAVAGEPDWNALLGHITRALGEQALLTSCRFGPGRVPAIQQSAGLDADEMDSAWIVLGGVVEAYPEVPALLLRLEALGLFEHVKLVETWSEPFAGEPRIGFHIACRAQ